MGTINIKKGLEEGKVTKNSNCSKRAELGLEGQCFPALKGTVSKRLLLFGVAAARDPEAFTPHPLLLLCWPLLLLLLVLLLLLLHVDTTFTAATTRYVI